MEQTRRAVGPAMDLRQSRLLDHWVDSSWEVLVAAARKREVRAGTRIRPPKSELVVLLAEGRASGSLTTSLGPAPLHTIRGPALLYPGAGFIEAGQQPEFRVVEPSLFWAFDVADLRRIASSDRRFRQDWYWTSWKSLAETVRTRNRMLEKFFEESDELLPTPSTSLPHSVKVPIAEKRHLFHEKGLSDLVTRLFSTLAREQFFHAESVIFAEGEAGETMYVVVEGEVMLSRRLPGVGREAITFVGPGEFFGAMALLDDHVRASDATARSEGATVLAISRELVHQILSTDRVSSLRMLELLCEVMARRLREIEEKIIFWFTLAGGALGPLTER